MAVRNMMPNNTAGTPTELNRRYPSAYVVPTTSQTVQQLSAPSFPTVTGDGVTDDYAGLNTLANTTIPATGGTIHFSEGTYLVNTNLTLPNTAALSFARGAALKPASGVTITINGSMNAGEYQIFDLSAGGTVKFGGETGVVVSAAWFGALPGRGIANATAVTAGLNALFACYRASVTQADISRKITLYIPPGRYTVNGEIWAGFSTGGLHRNYVLNAQGVELYVVDSSLAGKTVVDFSGIQGGTEISGLVVTTDSSLAYADLPAYGWAQSRIRASSTTVTSGILKFNFCEARGYYQKAPALNYASEECVYRRCEFENKHADGTWAFIAQSTNYFGWKSNFSTSPYTWAFSVDASTDTFTVVGHNFQPTASVPYHDIRFMGGTAPGGFSTDTLYYVRDIVGDTFKLSGTAGGAAIDVTSSAGTGCIINQTTNASCGNIIFDQCRFTTNWQGSTTGGGAIFTAGVKTFQIHGGYVNPHDRDGILGPALYIYRDVNGGGSAPHGILARDTLFHRTWDTIVRVKGSMTSLRVENTKGRVRNEIVLVDANTTISGITVDTGLDFTPLVDMAFSCDPATDRFTVSEHGLRSGDIVVFDDNDDAVATPPTGFSLGVNYYVAKIDDDTFTLSLSSGGAVIDVTANDASANCVLNALTIAKSVRAEAASARVTGAYIRSDLPVSAADIFEGTIVTKLTSAPTLTGSASDVSAEVIYYDATPGLHELKSMRLTATGATGSIMEKLAVTTVTADYTVQSTDDVVLVDTTSGAVQVNLFGATSNLKGRCLTFVKINAGANNFTLEGGGTDTINGASNIVTNVQWQVYRIVCDGSNWVRLA